MLAVGLLVLWIVGLAEGVPGWFAWWTFSFGVAYALMSFVRDTQAGSDIERHPTLPHRL